MTDKDDKYEVPDNNPFKIRLDALREAIYDMWYGDIGDVNYTDKQGDIEELAFTDTVTGEWLPPYDWSAPLQSDSERE